MRTLGRVFGVSLSSMHEMVYCEDFAMGPQPSEQMVADFHTKAFPESKSEECARVRRHANILSTQEVKEIVCPAGPGWSSRCENTGLYKWVHQTRANCHPRCGGHGGHAASC